MKDNPWALALLAVKGFQFSRSLTRMYCGQNAHPGRPDLSVPSLGPSLVSMMTGCLLPRGFCGRWIVFVLFLNLFFVVGLVFCGLPVFYPSLPGQDDSAAVIHFQNVAPTAGLRFVLENSPTPRKHLIETMAGGVATFDYDGDGLTDIYFTNGASFPSLEKTSAKYWNRLYRNLGGFHFEDVTEKAGVAGIGYSMGAAAADYDNDGHVDLFVAGVGRNILYHNRGDGTFEDATEQAGIKSGPWSIGAAWFDYDNDGLLDLFVVNYVQWSPTYDRSPILFTITKETGSSRMSLRSPVSLRISEREWVLRSPTTIMTALWMFSWQMTRCGTSFSTTSDTESSKRSLSRREQLC
jgi:hypothetical protein